MFGNNQGGSLFPTNNQQNTGGGQVGNSNPQQQPGSLFGGQQNTQGSLFGNTQGGFGQQNQQTTQSLFGQNNQAQSFGQNNQNTGFGQNYQNNQNTGFGQNTGGSFFGNTAQNTNTIGGNQGSLFGNNQNTGFGTQQQNTGFGANNQGGLFGNNNNQQGGMIGNNSNTGFGQNNNFAQNNTLQNNNTFGQGGFGQNNNTGTLFGQQNTGFGQTSTFGQQTNISTFGSNQQSDHFKDLNVQDAQQPEDTISCISWCPNIGQNMFAVSCWDGKVKIYKINNNSIEYVQQCFIQQHPEPVISLCWNSNGTVLYTGCADNILRSINLQNNCQMNNIGSHIDSIKDVFFCQQLNAIISVSFDKKVKFWQEGNPNALRELDIQNVPFVSDFLFPYLIIGQQLEKFCIINVNQIQNIQSNQIQYHDSPLSRGSQLQSIQLTNTLQIKPNTINNKQGNFNPNMYYNRDNLGVAFGSVDGRVNLTLLEEKSPGQFNLHTVMTFKAHKVGNEKLNQQCISYPVNVIGFNPVKNKEWVFTAGSDGEIQFWDLGEKNKIVNFQFNKKPVTAACVSYCGNYLAYATGYDWAKGHEHYNR